jgi:hypothetical protein
MTNRDSTLEAAFVKLMALIYRNVGQRHCETSKKDSDPQQSAMWT